MPTHRVLHPHAGGAPDLADDARSMARALELAELARGSVEPNPVVGAVVVKDGVVIGEGYHARFGGPHAEIIALENAGSAAAGATVYVSLEPCCHSGKTGPCTKALIAARVARVVAPMLDANPLVAGKGIMELHRSGIGVTVGPQAAAASRINAPFFKLITRRRPYVLAKWAQSIDGALADRHGQSQWISGAESRQQVHRLRGRVDAIMVGISTALADDPLLTARPENPADVRRTAVRCVLDTHCRLPLESQLVRTAREVPVRIYHAIELNPQAAERREGLLAAGVACRAAGGDNTGLEIGAILNDLGAEQKTHLLIEGGGRLLSSFLHAQAVDEAHVYIAPLLITDPQACRPAGGTAEHLAAALRGKIVAHNMSGPDVMIRMLFAGVL